jgi:hypothetical protein
MSAASDKVGLKLALRDWIYVLFVLAGMIAYFVRIEMQVRDIATIKADIRALSAALAEQDKRITKNEMRHESMQRFIGPRIEYRGERQSRDQ